MAASVKSTENLTFGTPIEASVIMQSVDETRTVETAEARDEDGDIVGIAFYGGQRQEVTGEYLYTGSGFADLGAAITLTNLEAISPAGDLYLVEQGTRTSNTGFKTGSFRAVAISGITG